MGRYGEIWGDAGRYEEGVSASAVLAREEALVGDDGRHKHGLVDEQGVDDEEEEASERKDGVRAGEDRPAALGRVGTHIVLAVRGGFVHRHVADAPLSPARFGGVAAHVVAVHGRWLRTERRLLDQQVG